MKAINGTKDGKVNVTFKALNKLPRIVYPSTVLAKNLGLSNSDLENLTLQNTNLEPVLKEN